MYSARGNLVDQLLASDTTVSHLFKALADAFQSSWHESMLHRFHLAIPKQISQVFQVSGRGLVVVGHGWVVFKEEPKGLDMYMSVDELCNLKNVCTLPRAV